MLSLQQLLNYPPEPTVHTDRELYKTGTIGTSDCNDYVPLYSIFAHDMIVINDTDIKVLEYSLPKVTSITSAFRNYTYLQHGFIGTYRNGIKFSFTIGGAVHSVNIIKGTILDHTGEVLVCVGINKEYLMSTSYVDIKTINPEKYVLFISNKINEPIYKNLKKKLEKELFPTFITGNIDVLYTNSINKWLFKNNFKQPKFKSVKESAQHLKEVSQLFLKV